MNDSGARRGLLPAAGPADLSSAPIRAQLLWASLFPLALFGLLAALVTSTALHQMTLNLVLQRNTAQVQVLAAFLAQDHALTPAALDSALQTLDPISGSRLYVIDLQGNLVDSSEAGQSSLPLSRDVLASFARDRKPASQSMESTVTSDELVVSFAPLPGADLGLIITEPWGANMAPAFYYQVVLVGLLALGTSLSLGMLALGIGRVIRPIAVLAEQAAGAVPGSVFHPVAERGPQEIRALIRAFNTMVIRLAEQQTTLRQYAHQALLSQEKERQRVSHELHDGTLQDLMGLAQRVELCRNELERDPLLARRRLDELQGLLEQTLGGVRRISNALRPPVLEDLGLAVALEALGNDLKKDHPGLQCDYAVFGEPRRLQPDLELAVYRIVQEALANIRKHAQGATRVQVELTFGQNEIQAKVKNDGAVFANQAVRAFVRLGHLGLAGMYERARLFGGTLQISSDPEEDTLLTLQLPCVQDAFHSE